MAAVGFSVAMWAFIAMAVLGLILKVVGPKDAEEGLAAAGISISQIFNLDNKPAETDANGSAANLAPDAGPITRLNGQALGPAESKPPTAGEPGKAPEAPAKPEPAPH